MPWSLSPAVAARHPIAEYGMGQRAKQTPEAFMTHSIEAQLKEFRASIDNLDAALIYLLSERFKLTKKVGEFKRDHDLPPADPAREKVQIARLRELAQASHLDPDFAEGLLRFIIDEVIRNHEHIRKR
jgi:chorismate mutase